MARLQILELPKGDGDDRPPFALVVDQCQGVPLDMVETVESSWRRIGEEIGARGALIFMETVEIPASEVATGPDGNSARLNTRDTDAELRAANEWIERLTAERDEARQWARHGYEIGQRHCGWTDHGVAPAWLTEGWPRAFDSCEHLKRAAEYDEALTRVRNEPTDPEIMDARQEHPGVWRHGYHCGVLAAQAAARPRNEPTRATEDGD